MILLSDQEFGAALAAFERSAFRLELQPAYNEPDETEIIERWRKGDREAHVDPFSGWYLLVVNHRAHGRVMQRVRVQQPPLSEYQVWERWVGRWNTAAGEDIRYMTRDKAHEVGLLPAAGDKDWWLLDEQRLIVMTFDSDNRRVSNELVTDPAMIDTACAWRDLALAHSAPP